MLVYQFYNFRYVFAKTTVSGNTTFYALYLNSTEQRAYFEYRQENLTEGYRTLNLYNVNLADGDFHHFAVAVYGTYFALFVDGRLHRSWMRLDGVLHDKQGMLCVGKKQNNTIRYAGTYVYLHAQHYRYIVSACMHSHMCIHRYSETCIK